MVHSKGHVRVVALPQCKEDTQPPKVTCLMFAWSVTESEEGKAQETSHVKSDRTSNCCSF